MRRPTEKGGRQTTNSEEPMSTSLSPCRFREQPTRRLQGAAKVDFDGMVERRAIRVAVPYSRSLYFNDKGRERGLSADFVRDFEGYINRKYKKQLGQRPITVIMRPEIGRAT